MVGYQVISQNLTSSFITIKQTNCIIVQLGGGAHTGLRSTIVVDFPMLEYMVMYSRRFPE